MVAKANGKLRDATEQLREVLIHRLRSEARIAAMEKRLAIVKENRQKHEEGQFQSGSPEEGTSYKVIWSNSDVYISA